MTSHTDMIHKTKNITGTAKKDKKRTKFTPDIYLHSLFRFRH